MKIRRYDSDCFIEILNPANYFIHVTNTNGRLETVSSVANRLSASIVINGDGWNYLPAPLSLAASEGLVYQSYQMDYRPFVNFDKNNVATIRNDKKNLYNTASGTRYMVRNGVKQGGTSSAWTTRNPRTAVGVRRNGEIILLVVDGRSTVNLGVTLYQLADILFEYGAVDALELDGGGSSAMWNGKIVNVPSDGRERPVINHIVFKLKETPTMAYKYQYVNTAGNMSIRPAPNTNNTAIGTLPINV
jgi:exopolysaccharide biosynthesis protein